MAKNYVDNLSEEVKTGGVQKCEEGHYPGKAPIGYLNVGENGRRQLAIDPERALLVRNLFELYDRGEHSIEGLATYAQQSGLRGLKGGLIGVSVIHSALRNPLYAGQFWWGGRLPSRGVRRLKFPDDIREAFVASLRDSRREVEVDVRTRITAAQARLERVSRLINAAYARYCRDRAAFLRANPGAPGAGEL
jgi:hypothetical protein